MNVVTLVVCILLGTDKCKNPFVPYPYCGFVSLLIQDGCEIGITVPDTVDSEMFEWTQRLCSPKLNFSPRKQQVPLFIGFSLGSLC